MQLSFLDPLLEIVCLAQESGALSEAQSAEQFRKSCSVSGKRPRGPRAPRHRLIRFARFWPSEPRGASVDPDEAMRNLLLGSGPPAEVALENGVTSVDSSKARHGG